MKTSVSAHATTKPSGPRTRCGLWAAGFVVWAVLGLSNVAIADRYINFDADPAAFGINGETINPTEFEVQYFTIPTDNNKIGFRLHNQTQPENYVEIRGIIPLAEGQTFTLDGIALLPYITIDPNTIGSLAPATQMPGSNPGIDNIYELDSSMQFGSQFFRLGDQGTPIGTINFYMDLDSDIGGPLQLDAAQRSVLKWNENPTGYNFTTPLTTFNNYHSTTDGEPTGWSPGQKKNFRIKWKANMINSGEIDLANAEIRYKTIGADERTTDEETLSAMTKSHASPFTGQTLTKIPDAYKILVRIQNNSNIVSESYGVNIPIVPIGEYLFLDGVSYGMFAPNADDGSGVFPGSIDPNDLVREDTLDADGHAFSVFAEPGVVVNGESIGRIKARY